MSMRMSSLFFILVIREVAEILDIVYRLGVTNTRFRGWVCLLISAEWREIPSPKALLVT
jgi:hypothetical protein